MKKYTTDMIKLLTLLIVTPMLVMAYTKIEKTVSPNEPAQVQKDMPGITPVSIGLMKENSSEADITIPKRDDDFILIRSTYTNIERSTNGHDIVQSEPGSRRFALVL